MSYFLWRPVIAGMWRQHEIDDGTYTFQDLVDVNKVLDVKLENENRRAEAIEALQKRK